MLPAGDRLVLLPDHQNANTSSDNYLTSSLTPSGRFFSSRHLFAWNCRLLCRILFSIALRGSSSLLSHCSDSLPTTLSMTWPAQESLPTVTEKSWVLLSLSLAWASVWWWWWVVAIVPGRQHSTEVDHGNSPDCPTGRSQRCLSSDWVVIHWYSITSPPTLHHRQEVNKEHTRLFTGRLSQWSLGLQSLNLQTHKKWKGEGFLLPQTLYFRSQTGEEIKRLNLVTTSTVLTFYQLLPDTLKSNTVCMRNQSNTFTTRSS